MSETSSLHFAGQPDDWGTRLRSVIAVLDHQLAELDALGIMPGAGELDLAIARLRAIAPAGAINGADTGQPRAPS